MKSVLCDGQDKPQDLIEQSDCTVIAIANASGIDYLAAYSIMAKAGRIPCRPYPIVRGIEEFNKAGARYFQFLKTEYETVAKFIKNNPRGRFILRTWSDCKEKGRRIGHVIAVVDGVYYDNFKPRPRKRVLQAWQLVSSCE